MSLRATFVGVNVYVDANISDLTGASWDAAAMAALFEDSLPEAETTSLRDEEATGAAIRDALGETLGQADPGDTALFFFAGHGSPAHQLVPSDARTSDLSGTTIPMEELAERLSATEARAAIVILDCCFSGGATARVLQDAPAPRDVSATVRDLEGEGRVIIAASKDDEPAYEMGNHGLLTKSLISTLRAAEVAVDIGDLMQEASAFVQAEAERVGFSQTPVLLARIEGGFTLPSLQAGPAYAEVFPETSGIEVSAAVEELSAFGIPDDMLSEWASRFPGGLNDLQLKAVNDYRVLDGSSLLAVAPTSAGKTFIGEMAGAKAVAEGRKAVFLLPYRALTNEKYEDFEALYGERLGMRVIRCTGGYSDDVSHFVKGKYDFAFLTYEMFLGLSVSVPASLHKIGLVVVDEAQFITDPTRGIAVELMLTNLLAARERGAEPQLLALSAVIGDINHFDEWLGCDTLVTKERPVPLVEGVLDRSGTFQYIDAEGSEQMSQLLPARSIRQRKKRKSSQDVIVPLAQQLVGNGEKILIFRNTKGSAAGCANYLANELGLPPASEAIERLPGRDQSSTSESLRRALKGGTALHTGNLTREERTVVEEAFREAGGPVHALAATTTVAAGVNTPASTVIIAEHTFYTDDGRQDFTVGEYKNMAGRAGRLGIEDRGRSVLLASSAVERRQLFEQYVRGEPEPVRSSFAPGDLPTWILRLLAQVDRIPTGEVVRLLARTYGGYLQRRQGADWRGKMTDRLEELLGRMQRRDLVEEDRGEVRLSLLGQACGESNLSFEDAMDLISILEGEAPRTVTAERLMAILQRLSEDVVGYTSLYKRGSSKKEAAWQREVTRYYGRDVTRMLQRGASNRYEHWGRCKRAAILWEWTRGYPTREIEKKYSVTPYGGSVGAGDIRRFADRTRFHLRSAFDIADVLLLGEGPDEKVVDRLLRQLEVGLPAGALGLLDLPLRLTRGEYLALHEAGFEQAEEVRKAPTSGLSGHVGETRAEELSCL